ncbi:neutral zinc metallopeptidase [soil metagenome]
MSFNDDANLDTSQVTSGGRGKAGGVAIGGGIGGIVLVAIFTLLSGGSLTDALGGAANGQFGTSNIQEGGSEELDFSQCKTGADANDNDTCRIIGTVNSVQDYWTDALPADIKRQYREATTVIYSGSTQSACGAASSATGPFYCPSDERVYIDASFFDELSSKYGADGGALAQEYVVAHEYGHHVQNILGILGQAQNGSGATGGSVRVELMADCLAGVWANHASSTQDDEGNALLEPLTRTDIKSALSAAAAVGDDRIQQASGGTVNPEGWTHGSSAQRERWFTTGYEDGNINSCDTLSAQQL